jgi:hypothetical protein
MIALDGPKDIGNVFKKLQTFGVFLRIYKFDDILEKIDECEKVCIISPTIPYDIAYALSNFYNCQFYLLYNHPSLQFVKDDFLKLKNIKLVNLNIYTKETYKYTDECETVILHDFQFMAPLEYLPYSLSNKNVITFYNSTREFCDEEIIQNFKK